MKCAICELDIEKKYTPDGEMYWDKGESGWPVVEGRVCTECNHAFVIPKRIAQIYENNPDFFKDSDFDE